MRDGQEGGVPRQYSRAEMEERIKVEGWLEGGSPETIQEGGGRGA